MAGLIHFSKNFKILNSLLVLFFLHLASVVLAQQVEFKKLKSTDNHFVFDTALKEKEVAITFEGTVLPKEFSEILSILKKNELKAHFFITGDSAIKFPELVSKTILFNHIIGSAGLEKPLNTNQFSSPLESLKAELQQAHEMVYMTTGIVFPFIRLSPRHIKFMLRSFMTESGIFSLFSNISPSEKSTQQDFLSMLKEENYRGIISIKLAKPNTISLLKTLITEIKNQDLAIIQFLPPAESVEDEKIPLIRNQIIQTIKQNGSIFELLQQQKENLI